MESSIDPAKKPLKKDSSHAPAEFRRIRLDTMIGMAFSNLIALSVIVTTAVTLHDSIHLSKPESGSGPALGGEEWLERALSHLGRHADSGVADLEMHGVGSDAWTLTAGKFIGFVMNTIAQAYICQHLSRARFAPLGIDPCIDERQLDVAQ